MWQALPLMIFLVGQLALKIKAARMRAVLDFDVLQHIVVGSEDCQLCTQRSRHSLILLSRAIKLLAEGHSTHTGYLESYLSQSQSRVLPGIIPGSDLGSNVVGNLMKRFDSAFKDPVCAGRRQGCFGRKWRPADLLWNASA